MLDDVPSSVSRSRAQETAFGPVTIGWDDGVLSPRPWTLLQSQWAVELLSSAPPGPLLELCCGAGQIGLATAALAGRPIVQIDADAHACRWATRNADRAGVVADVRCADLRERPFLGLGADEQFPIVLADPPYLRSDVIGRYPDDPVLAIDGGANGLDLVIACLDLALAHAMPGAAVLVQVRGAGQAAELERSLECMPTLGAPINRARIEEVRTADDDHASERAVVLVHADVSDG